MAHYIDKDAVVDWIMNSFLPTVNSNADEWERGADSERLRILSFINSLEVKEVDLEKEYEEFVVDDPILNVFIQNDVMGMKVAKHFFELGLKAKDE